MVWEFIMKRAIFEQVIGFVSELEGRESELDMAKKLNIKIEDDEIARVVIHKLKHAIQHVNEHPLDDDQARTLYHVALYAKAISKPLFGIPLCYIVINHPATSDATRTLAQTWLDETKQKIPADMFNDKLKETKLDIDEALQESTEWLTVQERHATQPATKPVFNSDLIKKQQRNKR